jgi:uncharacterized NAD-dependent epimerase/dehydratase family protein
VVRYRPEEVVALLDTTQVGKTSQELLGVGGNIPVVGSVADAPRANTLLIGIAPAGGRIPAAWRAIIMQAIERGMNVVSGLHEFISSDPEFSRVAAARGVMIHDVRKNNERDVTTRKGIREDCLRIHTVGNDCSIGKMIVSIEVARALQKRGHDAKFVATGQTGIMVEGDGCPVDCVVSDFVNGAAEKLVLANQHHDFLLIEGQGSLSHPRYSAVTLGLLHGSMPQGLIMCYEAGRTHVRGMEQIPLKPLAELIRVYETMGSLQTRCKVIGIGVNTRKMSDREAQAERERTRTDLGLPTCDVIRDGPDELVEAVLDYQKTLFPNRG